MARVCRSWREAVQLKRAYWQRTSPGTLEWTVDLAAARKHVLVLSPIFFKGENNFWVILYPDFRGGQDCFKLYFAPAYISPDASGSTGVEWTVTMRHHKNAAANYVRDRSTVFHPSEVFTKCGVRRPIGNGGVEVPNVTSNGLVHDGTTLKIDVEVTCVGPA